MVGRSVGRSVGWLVGWLLLLLLLLFCLLFFLLLSTDVGGGEAGGRAFRLGIMHPEPHPLHPHPHPPIVLLTTLCPNYRQQLLHDSVGAHLEPQTPQSSGKTYFLPREHIRSLSRRQRTALVSSAAHHPLFQLSFFLPARLGCGARVC